ncbi:HK97 gp10 family phage protein [Ruminococcus sp.]|uniref:HK97 gp10 family phage protein n=1 Tax=Ruminococcus sp. TaxID=41978 RepID=UPI001B652FE0|nr:HK97 gp10 family phage protein [Ruminococcus sp.]MBP5431614.1 HK97 gp10 family phage protein [Ruminococcus sp.]
MNITPDQLTEALVNYCKGYTEEIKEIVGAGIETIGAEAVEEVKALAPVYTGGYKGFTKGAYRRSWSYIIEKSNGNINVTVYAKGKHYRLTHLLENGHLNRDGTTRSRAIPHISTANDSAQQKVDRLLEEL